MIQSILMRLPFSRLIGWSVIAEVTAAAPNMSELPAWIQILERLGSFALIAFLIYYFVKVALPLQRQDYISSQKEQRADFLKADKDKLDAYIAAEANARADYLTTRKEDREVLMRIADSAQKNSEATLMHVSQAQLVWERSGALPTPPDDKVTGG